MIIEKNFYFNLFFEKIKYKKIFKIKWDFFVVENQIRKIILYIKLNN